MFSKNSSSIVNSFGITTDSKKGNEKSEIGLKQSTSKSDKNLGLEKKREHAQKNKKKDKKEFMQVKKKLKETECKLAEALKTIESYRSLYIKKQKELEKWQELNAQLQSKVYEKIDEYGNCFKFYVNDVLLSYMAFLWNNVYFWIHSWSRYQSIWAYF